jgi:hypothetical protein
MHSISVYLCITFLLLYYIKLTPTTKSVLEELAQGISQADSATDECDREAQHGVEPSARYTAASTLLHVPTNTSKQKQKKKKRNMTNGST